MTDRFERLFELPNNLYSSGLPIVVAAGALLKDTQSGNVIVQLKFQNISDLSIKALKVTITAFDATGEEIEGVKDYQYLDLKICSGGVFGSNKAIVMPKVVTRSFAIRDICVVLGNGAVYNVTSPLTALPKAESLRFALGSAELVKQFRIATNDKAAYVPQEFAEIWQCSCGEWNGLTSCSTCGAHKLTIFSAYNPSALAEMTNNRLAREKAEQEEKAKQERIVAKIEAERLAAKAEKNRAAMKKVSIAAAIIAPIVALILVFSLWLYPYIIQPNSEYKAAQALLADGKYDDAVSAFMELGDYKDSAEMVTESLYQKANSSLNEQKYDDSIAVFGKLDGYKDSTDKIKEAKYQKALFLAETGSLEDAIAILKTLNGYAESNSNLEALNYEYAGTLLDQGNYDEAKVIYQSIGAYEDSADMVLECDYLKASALLSDGSYEDALEIFLQIKGYKDADNGALNCKYRIARAAMDISHYSDAIALFEELGSFEDSANQLIESKYQLAKLYTSRENYEAANQLFEEISNYKDANTFMQLISQTNSMVYQTHDNFQYWYLWVRIDVDVENCSLKVLGQEARSNDLVNIGEQNYSIDYLWRFEEWKKEDGKYLMAFLGSNPSEDRTSYREWTVTSNWGSIRSQTMVYTGEILGDPGEYVDNYTRIADEEVTQTLIERFQNYRGN